MTEDDIKRLNHVKYTDLKELVNNPPSLMCCLLLHFLRIPYQLIKRRVGRKSVKDILFIESSLNNKKSLDPIKRGLHKDSYSVWNQAEEDLPYIKIYLHSLIYLWTFIKLYYHSKPEEKRMIRFFSSDFILACSTYVELDKQINKYKNLRLIIFANDHNLVNRVLIEIAEKKNIKTLYVQHASIDDGFPPLRFDYSFLDGGISLETYRRIGNMRGEVYLTGSPRFDIFHDYQSTVKKYDVGIAMNELDSQRKVFELCKYLRDNYSRRIIVRPHPHMFSETNKTFNEDIFRKEGFDISYPSKDLSNVFLSEIKVMISNESGIHLDAALMGVPSFLYNFSDHEVMDMYSYIKTGLIKECKTYQEVLKNLSCGYNLPEDVVRYYAASFHTKLEGRIGPFIANFIKKEIYESTEAAHLYLNRYLN